jgi:hypothetical protein
MLRGMSARQFSEWRAYHDLEPFDEERADIRAGSIVQAIFSTSRRKGSPPIKLMDCVVRFGSGAGDSPKSVEQAREEIVKTMDFLAVIFNSEHQKASKPRVRRER